MRSAAVHSLAVIWRAGGLLFSTPVGAVVEVLSPVKATETATVPEWVRGIFSYRGELIPLIDAALLLGREKAPDRMSNRVLVVRTERGGEEMLAGLWVESVVELDRLDYSNPGNHAGFEGEASRYLGPITQTRFGPVQEMRTDHLFTPEQAELLWARVKAGAA